MATPNCAWGDDQDANKTEITIRTGVGGTGILVPGKWGQLRLEAVNAGDTGGEAYTVNWFGRDTGLQFGRRIWVPPNATRRTWCPALMPNSVARREQLKSIMIDDASGTEVIVRKSADQMIESQTVMIEQDQFVTGLLGDGTDAEVPIRHAITALRVHARYGRRLVVLNSHQLPSMPETLQGLDQLVITGNDFISDTAGVAAIRQWIRAGGRAWIPLDLVDMNTVRLLLGDAVSVEEMDRVAVSEGVIRNLVDFEIEDDRFESDQPRTFVRILADHATVTHELDGWPAACWQNVGQGRVVFTTLETAAWLKPPAPEKPGKTANGAPPLPFAAGTALKKVWIRLYDEGESPPVASAELKAMLVDEVGYETPSGFSIASVLTLYCFTLLALGFWFDRRGQLEQLMWAIPTATVIAVIPLITLGAASRSAVPATVASAQLINVQRGQDEALVSGVMALYNNGTDDMQMAATDGGLFLPDRKGMEADIWRMTWSDMNHWQFENTKLPTGLRVAPFSSVEQLTAPIEATGTFGPEGFICQLASGSFGTPADILLATESHFTLPLADNGDGLLRGTQSDVLPPGEYMSGGMLTSEQQRHQKIYRELFHTDRRETKYPRHPAVFAWTDARQSSFQFSEDTVRSGAALLSVPLDITRPAPGTHISIPSPFLRYRAAAAANNAGFTTTYANNTGEWQPGSRGCLSTLQIQIPKVLLPLTLESLEVTLKINATLRDVVIQSGNIDNLVQCASEHSPVGVLQYQIDRPEALQLADNGTLYLTIDVGDLQADTDADSQEVQNNSKWHIDWLKLHATAIVDQN